MITWNNLDTLESFKELSKVGRVDIKEGGGPYLIQMLFKEPVEMPDKEKMTAIMLSLIHI